MNAPETRLRRARGTFSGLTAEWGAVVRRNLRIRPARQLRWERWTILAIFLFAWVNAIWLLLTA